jgi:hypothetical protein
MEEITNIYRLFFILTAVVGLTNMVIPKDLLYKFHH